ncbi:glycosyltransferase [Mucilaginibacter sp. SP1R1]|uniref:glycosyltransferase n=1 Tax=Mucilaginibacter sp. SP1R1 TaxID=2723091 RepID=UPI00160FBA40|nr:glycosyltransferase involved in cell wall biosynthesis [Mucilaginibacter sp. SP1R1]
MIKLSIIICTYNPRVDYLNKVLHYLQLQTLATSEWQLIIIDNKSDIPISHIIDISWHLNSAIIREEKIGLINARITGVNNASANVVIFVDDDNVLDTKYLEKSWQLHQRYDQVGSFGGKALPEYESQPPAWFFKTGINLGCQNHGDQLYVSDYKKAKTPLIEYPPKAPIGTGMVITKEAFLTYLTNLKENDRRLLLGRNGNQLISGEDNDIILTIIKNGFEIAYFPELIVYHLIPQKRVSYNYLKEMSFESSRSWIKVLLYHNMCPWNAVPRWTVTPRKIKAWIYYRAWKSPANYIKWRGACGMFKALSEIHD